MESKNILEANPVLFIELSENNVLLTRYKIIGYAC